MSHWFECPVCGAPATRGAYGIPEPCSCGSGILSVRAFTWPKHAVLQQLVDRRKRRILPRIFYCPLGRLLSIWRGRP